MATCIVGWVKIPAQLNRIQFFCHENHRILLKILLGGATLWTYMEAFHPHFLVSVEPRV